MPRFNHLLKEKRQQALEAHEFDTEKLRDEYIDIVDQRSERNFEVWNPVPRAPVETKESKKRKLENDADLQEETEVEEEVVEEEIDTSTAYEYEKIDFDKYEILESGHELNPPKFLMSNNKLATKDPLSTSKISFTQFNIKIMTNILHLSMLRQDWNTASNTFALLIRMNNINLKNMWTIGLEILIRLEEQSLRKSASDLGIDLDQHQARALSNLDANADPSFLVLISQLNNNQLKSLIRDCNSHKVEKFLNWLRTYYNVSFLKPSKLTPPFWRSGSRTQTPMYFYELIWFYLIKLDFRNCKDLLTELLLQQPFSSDGVFHYMLGLCYQVEAFYNYDLKKKSFKEIHELVIKCLDSYTVCLQDFKIEVPSQMLKDLSGLLKRIGVQNVPELFEVFQNHEEVDFSKISVSSGDSSPVMKFASDSEEDSLVNSDVLELVNFSPLSQDSIPNMSSAFKERHRTNDLDTVLDLQDTQMNFDSDLSSD